MFKLLVFIFLFFFLLGPVIRFAFRFFVMNKVVKEQKKYYDTMNNRKEGEIKVEVNPTKSSTKTDNIQGQYIDFEEVK